MSACWLVKQEPSAYPFSRFLEDGRTTWDGVRNAQARIHLRAMTKGDDVFYYHSGDDKAIVGLAKVARAAYPDPTDPEGAWVAVDLSAVKALPHPVTLAVIKADPALQGMALIKQSRLSVMPLTPSERNHILALGK